MHNMEQFFKNVKEYWFMIIFIGMVIVSWTTFSQRLTVLEGRVTKLEVALDALEQIRTDIAVIKNDIISIKQTLRQ